MNQNLHVGHICRLCGGSSTKKFSQTILAKYNIAYYLCNTCHSLQTQDPFWLEEAYSQQEFNLDTMALQRNINNFAICYTVCKVLSARTVIDFGAKDGLLCRFLRDHEINCFAYDKYSKPSYVIDFADPPKEGIDLLMAFEVLEHLPNSSRNLEEIFSFKPKFFLFQTSLYSGQDADWSYLSKETGQHVFFYSLDALKFIANKYGYNVAQLGWTFFFYKPDTPDIQRNIIAAQTALSGWIFQAIKSYIFLLPTKGHVLDQKNIISKLVR
jgi:hypothetical protein